MIDDVDPLQSPVDGRSASLRALDGQARGGSSPQLWGHYERLVTKLEEERSFVLGMVEHLRVPPEDGHRVEWETKRRLSEMTDLQVQLKESQKTLVEQQEDLLRVAAETDNIRAEAPGWAAELENVQAILCPRVDGVRYSPGVQPEKIGRFVPNMAKQEAANVSSFGQLGAADSALAGVDGIAHDSPGGPTVVEYLPHDRSDVVDEHLQELRQRLDEERRGHTAAKEMLIHLEQIEAEESELLLTSLREQLARVKRRREDIRQRADEVMHCHTRLQMEHEGLASKRVVEVEKMLNCNSMLSQHIQVITEKGHHKTALAEAQRNTFKEFASSAHTTGLLRYREDAALLHKQTDESEARSLRNIQGLERRLSALRERYDQLTHHRVEECTAVRKDVERLQHAVRQCEKLATHCVGVGFRGRGRSKRSRSTGCSGERSRDGADAAEALGALALGPAVRRLRQVLKRCEDALGEEQRHTIEHSSRGEIEQSAAETTE